MQASGPISNFTRAIATVVLCAPSDRPIVENGEVKVGKMMNMNITFDHRFLDGAGGSIMYNSIVEVWNNPENYF